ncbi:peptide ABC transporter substrate-binding protein [Luteolibacter marinus]|uniref:peptide ABC transporter substrate-binding protein n=1 Tax=Luteolibacter marinus TaxID=2776705 RepID=UPI001866C5D1|nr:peptide ABC transporter substrate-binding protein [Luteolibacter marinus]
MTHRALFLLPLALCLAGCQRETQVEKANREGIMLIGNSSEPKALDLHLVTGVIESKLIGAMFEGLVADDPEKDDGLPPGAAVSWEHNDTLTGWTFHLQPDGRWSDGAPVTAHDFVFSYHRMLHPDLAAPYVEMVYPLKNAEDYNKNRRGKILLTAGAVPNTSWDDMKDVGFGPDAKVDLAPLGESPKWPDLTDDAQRKLFVTAKGLDALPAEALEWILADPAGRYSWPVGTFMAKAKALLTTMAGKASDDLFELAGVGATAVDDYTLQLELREPVPYLPSLVRHYTWFPVPRHVVLKHGKISDRFTPWSLYPNIVGNGPFKLKTWLFHDVIEVDRNPHYWNAANVGLNGIRFLPIENPYTETRAFLSGQLHTTYQLPSDLIKEVRETTPEYLRQEPYVGTTFIRINTTRPVLSDTRVRQALALAIDRQQLCDYIMEGYTPATSLTPKMGSYEPDKVLSFDPEKARALLAEAGYPDGSGFPRFSLLISKPAARASAEAIQAMWKQNLNVLIDIQNKDWGSYISAQQSLDFDMASAGWIGDYLDPTTFLTMWTEGNGNNNTGWHSDRYEELLSGAALEADPAKRLESLRQAERLMMDEYPILPMSWYSRNYLLRPEVKGWHPLLLDNHPYSAIRLEP